ncbi:zinc transport system substrate-binding protein [Sedimentitalea nanhaiensis]|uniref:Zinc transport system substrate-binding protein n=3 Tax=Sedimentitalea nanhaiensis TaxID=999627 RepID=A0A1I6ZPU6_9RHOB|nr:zinc transport system substrate-binding protein [Sedimentitalea nanhaiensis]
MMHTKMIQTFSRLAAVAVLAIAAQAHVAHSGSDKTHNHGTDDIYRGYFDDAQIKERTLADWQGDWQSVYPHLRDGALDPVMAHKAEHGDKTAEQYRAYYETGYQTDVDRIVIQGDSVTFDRGDAQAQATYASDGYEILTYKKGNRGVRYIYRKAAGDAEAPQYIQFSDHHIAPESVGHYHLYWGEDRAEVLAELTNWPTYFPSGMTGEEIAADMLAH